jgi:DNA-binding response OmpR family regulator
MNAQGVVGEGGGARDGMHVRGESPVVCPRKCVLLFDDSPLILEMVRDALESIGLEVHTAVNLSEMECALARGHLDLALVDVNMPEAFGDDVAAVLRHMRKLTLPIYLFSNLEDEELDRRAADAQIDGYISKRWGLDAVLACVAEILARGAAS